MLNSDANSRLTITQIPTPHPGTTVQPSTIAQPNTIAQPIVIVPPGTISAYDVAGVPLILESDKSSSEPLYRQMKATSSLMQRILRSGQMMSGTAPRRQIQGL